jgi:putative PEP-CTERM system histidine kinase
MSAPAGKLSPSRALALAAIAILAAAAYFLAILGAFALLQAAGSIAVAISMFILPLISALAAAALLPARRTRAWFQVMLAKHLFAHRYDYRGEWLRFNDTLGRPGEAPEPLRVRGIKAIADIVHAPAGLLLMTDDSALAATAGWHRITAGECAGPRLITLLESGRIIQLDPLRLDTADGDEAAALPQWILNDQAAWVIVPLLHFDRLAGAVLLERPAIARTLDWEDFDLLRVVGRQVASYLAEADGQDALSEARRFDEFNRRFAFIMHDIKNLVSQLALVARNAERHADNPDFRADMIATLHNSTARMNDLLARLSQHNTARPEDPRAISLEPLITMVAQAKRRQHPIVVAGEPALFAIADRARLETALSHLVQNAIEASDACDPVTVEVGRLGTDVIITVSDNGCGMTPEFIHDQLFRPFTSTKDGGFGIGAFEARTLITALGGRLSVRSAPDRGTGFTIWLPGATGWAEARAA